MDSNIIGFAGLGSVWAIQAIVVAVQYGKLSQKVSDLCRNHRETASEVGSLAKDLVKAQVDIGRLEASAPAITAAAAAIAAQGAKRHISL